MPFAPAGGLLASLGSHYYYYSLVPPLPMAVSGPANATGRRAPEMPKHTVSLDDKFSLDETHQLLTGTQAIVRLVLAQRARDVQAGLNTAGYVTGYRGSPIATLEAAFLRTSDIPGAQPDQVHGRAK